MLSDIIENQKNTISAFEQNLIQARESMSEEDVQTNILCIKNDAIVSLKHYCNIINDIYEGKSELAVEDQNKIKDSIQAEKNLNLDYEENYKAIEELFQLSKETDERLKIDLLFDICVQTFRSSAKTLSYIDTEVSNKILEIVKRFSK